MSYSKIEKQSQESAKAGIQFLTKRADRELAAIQTVEALRHYASTNQGRFPQTLADLTLAVPNDPTTGQPFVYRLKQGKAILESTPKVAGPRESLQYILEWR